MNRNVHMFDIIAEIPINFFQPGKVGVFDKNPYPVIDSYPQSKTVRVGDFVDIKCSASDTADHLPYWPKHDLTLSLIFEDEPSRDLSSSKFGRLAGEQIFLLLIL